MKKTFLLLLLCSYAGSAQINYEPGYFITNDGQKTNCLIRNVDWKNNPEEIDYILAENDKSKTLKVADIKEFGVGENNKYKKFSVKTDMSGRQADDLSHQKNPEWRDFTALLQVLVEGSVTLYRYEDTNVTRFFISTGNNDTAEQLVYKEYLQEGTTIHRNNTFRQQLLTLLGTENLTMSDYERVQYDEESLVKLFVKNNGTEQKSGFKNLAENHTKSTFHLKIIAGVGMGVVDYGNTLTNIGYSKNQPVYRFGTEAEIVFPFNRNKWSLLVSPNYQFVKAEGKFKGTDVGFDYKFIEISAAARHYFFLNNKLRLFVNLGYKLTLPSSSSEFTEGNLLPARIGKSTSSFAGLGLSNGRFWIEARYDFSEALIPDYSTRTGAFKSYGLILGYKFL